MRASNASEGSLRLFVAVELPVEVREALAGTIEAMQRLPSADIVRWVRPEGIHITLKFLGAVASGRLDEIRDALGRSLSDATSFRLKPGEVGSFGGRRNLRVVWVGVRGDGAALGSLAERVEAALVPLGFPPERREFNAHLTLGRVRDDAPAEDRAHLHDALLGLAVPAFPEFPVDQVSLMRSTLGPGGAKYDAIATFELG